MVNMRDWKKIIDEYLLYKRVQGLRENTLKTYARNLEFLLIKHKILDGSSLDFLKFFANLKEDDSRGDWRYSNLIEDLKTFVSWAEPRGYVPRWLNIELRDLKPIPRSRRKMKQDRFAYTPEQEKKILDSCKDINERFLWWLALNTGLRRKELMLLKLSDISVEGVTVRAEIAKNGKKRFVPFTSDQVKQVEYFLKHRALLEANSNYVFVNTKGEMLRLDYNSGFSMYKRLSEKCGFRVALHNARYTFAVRTWKETGDIRLVMALLGHHSPEETERYLRIRDEHVPDVLREKLERARRRSKNE